ncbi:MAG: bifunctional UDP-N-acetylmuramoyl-tripeptide:D-alanyl-D-alanine ligase/alanine racemase [Bacteroidetes bacterium]|nr:MAG: bifunctional UDP-N-acetylmuramoyl-tripeptide:D-alanyl-D-alanine ligase/alanine racemase [Bacteroidota bacterium]
MAFALSHIAHLLGTHAAHDKLIRELAYDSRRILDPQHALFFALSGKRDGHSFLDEAWEAGVRHFVVQKGQRIPALADSTVLEVESPLAALQKLAEAYRNSFEGDVVAITGSNGKTWVKEWLHHLLQNKLRLSRSPKSYNSQLGVPLSLWSMPADSQYYFVEAGISRQGEMKRLQSMLYPKWGILTSLGAAHDEGFKNREEKLQEKLSLFDEAYSLVYPAHDELIEKGVKTWSAGKEVKCYGWTLNKPSSGGLMFDSTEQHGITKLRFKNLQFELPYTDQASIENLCSCLAFAYLIGVDLSSLSDRVKSLPGIDMRLQLKKGKLGSTLINDAYSADLSSLEIALDFLERQAGNSRRVLVLSDLQDAGIKGKDLYSELEKMLSRHSIDLFIGIGKELFLDRPILGRHQLFFESRAQASLQLNLEEIKDSTVLIKGAREFHFERLVKHWEEQVHETVLEIDLNSLEHNFTFFKSKLKKGTRLMAMVKAHGYGAGSHEIAHQLQSAGADYLSVAYADEGIVLREKGISLPIMVMNPQRDSLEEMLDFGLEPDIYDFAMLDKLLETIQATGITKAPIHLEFDTGMHRLGFEHADVPKLLEILRAHPELEVKSVFAHLAASDESMHDSFTREQIKNFEVMRIAFLKELNYAPLFHILNTAGILRFPDAQFDMVRLGIGLYGIDPSGRFSGLQPVGTLKARISQIRELKRGETVGYSRKGILEKDSRIAVVSIGYADGFRRILSNRNGNMWVNGQRAPVVGNVCMDMTMIDVSDIACKEGDPVEVFGSNLPIEEVAEKCGTIPYELLTGVSQRVKRVYWKE